MADLENFRTETRAWLAANCPPEMRLPFADEDDRCWGGRNAAFKSDGAAPLVANVWATRGWTVPTGRRNTAAAGSRARKQRSCAGDAPPRLPLAA